MSDRRRCRAGGVLRLAASATLAAGLIGAVRQRGEARAVRLGTRAPVGPDGDPPPARRPGRLGARIAVWRPAPPMTRVGLVAAALWSAPLTAVGLVAATIGGGTPRWDRERRCWVALEVGGPSRIALRAVGAAANTIGTVVLVRGESAEAALLDHEAIHVRQAERLGPLLPIVYAWLAARHGYADNPLERAARAGARAEGAVRRARGAG